MKQAEEDIVNLRLALHSAIENALRLFQDRTGITPSEILVHMVETTWCGDGMKRYSLQNVSVKFEA